MTGYDAWIMAAVAAELRSLMGAKVQRVLRTGEDAYGMELYARGRRFYLLVSLAAQDSRLHLVGKKLRRGAEPSPLLLLMRKHLEGSRLAAVTQPPFERVLRTIWTHPAHGEVELVAEVMGRYSNLLLLDARGTIVGLHKSVGPKESRLRQLAPGREYRLPPQPRRRPITEVTTEDVAAWLSEGDGPLWRLLLKHVWGLSKPLAMELAYLAAGDVEARSARPEAIRDILGEWVARWAQGRWEPHVALRDGVPVACSPFRLEHLGRSEPVESMSRAIEMVVAAEGASDPYASARKEVRSRLREATKRLEKQRDSLLRQMPDAEEVARWLNAGNWILTYAGRIEPRQKELVVEETGERIPLDPELTPVENAQRYMKRYRKGKRALETVPPLLEAVERDLEYLRQLAYDLEAAKSRGEIDAVLTALAEMGMLPAPRRKPAPPPSGPLKYLSPDGFVVLVGRNARQNEEVTFRRAGPKDLWLHARGVPGAHVVVLTGGEPVSEGTLEFAARLAAYHSKARGEKAVDVIVARRRKVRRAPGGHPGQVLVSRGENLTVPGALPPSLVVPSNGDDQDGNAGRSASVEAT
jgi:predicted ribosome quality control (RQC) complex YloA/Tae2 family protein